MGTSPDYTLAMDYAFNRLLNELSPNLTYHSYWHTRFDVLPAAIRLAKSMNIQDEDRKLLEIGAVYHDIGFVISNVDHEFTGVEIVRQVLPKFSFLPEQIERVAGLIIATRLPQSPKNLLEELLADADLDVLGREDFFKRSEHLRLEIAALGRDIPVLEWYEIQMNFLKNHSYFTSHADILRQPSKEQHIAKLKEYLRIGKNGDGEPV